MGPQPVEKIQRSAQVTPDLAGRRLDQAAAALFEGFSRSRLQEWIRSGALRVDGNVARPRDRVRGTEELSLDAEPEREVEAGAEDLALEPLYCDEHLMVLDKPAGLVVHPAAGHASGTLLNGLLALDPALERLPRAGIVHRLDRDTTGLMVVARSLQAHAGLVEQLQRRTLGREYLAIAAGVLTGGGSVDAPIGRHPVDRKRMAVREGGREAVTHYRLEERFRGHTLLRVHLETGRTHQIRVHMAHLLHPLVGDPVYGGRPRFPAGATEALRTALQRFRRQALHAAALRLEHPVTGESLRFDAPLPEDFTRLLAVLRADQEAS